MRDPTLTSNESRKVHTMPETVQLNDTPYTPGKDPDIDMYMGHWQRSMPRHTHGSLIERDILTPGDPANPPAKGAVLKYINRLARATLAAGAATTPTTLQGEQEVLYVLSGEGTIEGRNGQSAGLSANVAALVPTGFEFQIRNSSDDEMAMYLVNEPIPDGFRPNDQMLVVDEKTAPIVSTHVHWCHITKEIFTIESGLGTLEFVASCSFDPMTMGCPHSHVSGCEEIWTAAEGTSIALLGKQLRTHEPGMSYIIPPNGTTPHSNINVSDKRIKMFYAARYSDHEVRK